jgi:hypothetical protein
MRQWRGWYANDNAPAGPVLLGKLAFSVWLSSEGIHQRENIGHEKALRTRMRREGWGLQSLYGGGIRWYLAT